MQKLPKVITIIIKPVNVNSGHGKMNLSIQDKKMNVYNE